MKQWKIADAKAKFSSVLDEAQKQPQVICRRDVPVAVVVNMASYQHIKRGNRPSISQMLRRLRKIQEGEDAEIEVSPRGDRAVDLLEG